MKKTATLLAALAVFWAAPLSAAEQGVAIAHPLKCTATDSHDVECPGTTRTTYTNLLEAAPLNGAASTLTVTVTLGTTNNPSQYTKVKLAVHYTEVAATAITGVYYCSIDGTNFALKTSRSIVSGASTVYPVTDTIASATASHLVEIGVAGCNKFRFIIAGTGTPGASDLVTVQGVAVVGE